MVELIDPRHAARTGVAGTPPVDPARNEGTLDALLARRAARDPAAPALLQKRHGVWQAWSWAGVEDGVAQVAAGLRAAGLRRDEAVGIVCGARVEAVLAFLACQRAGLVPVLLNPQLGAAGLARQVGAAGAVALVLEDQEQVDKVADTQSRLAGLRASWAVDTKGTRGYTHIRTRPFDALRACGALPSRPPSGSAAGAVLFTAGVHGEPRPLTVDHATLAALAGACDALGLRAGDRIASLFGATDPLGLYFAVVAPVLAGAVACFGEDRLPSVREMRECAPQVVAAPARLVDRLRRETASRAQRAGRLQRRLVERWNDGTRSGRLLRALVGRPIADGLGLGACRLVLTGYEPMTPATARFLERLGIDARGLFALAEAGGPVAILDRADPSALRPFPGCHATVDDDGMLLMDVAGRMVRTGDLAVAGGDGLRLVGRAAELLTLPDGSRLAPSVAENELLASPYVNQAVAVGGPCGGVVALIELDETTLRDWARAHRLPFTTLRQASQSSEVRRLVAQAVDAANQRLGPAARIRRFVLLPRALDPGNGELTPSLALRRAIVRNRYAHRLVEGESS